MPGEIPSQHAEEHAKGAPIISEKETPEGYVEDINKARAEATAGSRIETVRANMVSTGGDDETVALFRHNADAVERVAGEKFDEVEARAKEIVRDLANSLLVGGKEIKIDYEDDFKVIALRNAVIAKLDQMFKIGEKKVDVGNDLKASIGNIENLVKYQGQVVLYSFRPTDYEKVKVAKSETE